MLNHNHKNSDCGFAESLVAYLYGEASQTERIAFETHLENCQACGEELNEFSAARQAVHEWRAADFDVLPTPTFEVPARTTNPIIKEKSLEKSGSWFDGWRNIFSFRPALAMASLVVLVAFFGIAAFFLNQQTDGSIVGKNNDDRSGKTVAMPTVEPKIKESQKPTVAQTEPSAVEYEKNPPLKNDERKSASVKNAPLKVSTGAPKSNPAKTVQTDGKRTPKPKAAAPSDVPRIGETEDEEDDSIRLADLFEEVGIE